MTVHETTDSAAGQGGAAPRSARALARARRLHALARFWRQYRSHRGGVFG
ncbi:ABC transporter permease, partial [Streptomyces albidoflavus]